MPKISRFTIVLTLLCSPMTFASATDFKTTYCQTISNIATLSMTLRQDNKTLEYSQRYLKDQYLSQAQLDKGSEDYQAYAAVFDSLTQLAYDYPVATTQESKDLQIKAYAAQMRSTCAESIN